MTKSHPRTPSRVGKVLNASLQEKLHAKLDPADLAQMFQYLVMHV